MSCCQSHLFQPPLHFLPAPPSGSRCSRTFRHGPSPLATSGRLPLLLLLLPSYQSSRQGCGVWSQLAGVESLGGGQTPEPQSSSTGAPHCPHPAMGELGWSEAPQRSLPQIYLTCWPPPAGSNKVQGETPHAGAVSLIRVRRDPCAGDSKAPYPGPCTQSAVATRSGSEGPGLQL